MILIPLGIIVFLLIVIVFLLGLVAALSEDGVTIRYAGFVRIEKDTKPARQINARVINHLEAPHAARLTGTNADGNTSYGDTVRTRNVSLLEGRR